jgi:hypothetical protein
MALKRKASGEFPLRSPPPQPINGPRPIITSTLLLPNGIEVPVKVLLDWGSTVPVLSASVARKYSVPTWTREIPENIQSFAGDIVAEAGKEYSYPVVLQHQDHFTKDSYEIAPTGTDCDIILPWWWISKHRPRNQYSLEDIEFTSEYCKLNCTILNIQQTLIEYDEALAISDTPISCLGNIKQVAGATQIEWALFRCSSNGVISSVGTGGDTSATSSLQERIPSCYHAYISVFEKRLSEALPPHRSYDHAIDLKEGADPPWGPIYALSEKELIALREYLEEMLRTGKIRPSKSPAGSPILFVPKPNGKGLRLCVDYRGLNKITVLNRYPLPLMDELRDRVKDAKIFTKMDLKTGFNLVRIKDGDEWKTAFRTRYGLFEYLVMPFGLANAPATFQGMMNDIFRDLIDRGVLIYMDDFLVYTDSPEEHIEIVKDVLSRLQLHGLAVEIDKCEFHVPQVEFLGYMISTKGFAMSDKKIQSVQDWEQPKSVKEVQSFLGFANFYRRFIENFSKICKPLTSATAGGKTSVTWTPECESAFTELKAMFTSAPILAHFDSTLPTVLETDASDFAVGAVLSQLHGKRLHPVAFHSRKMDKAEINYDIHDKEMLAIVAAFKEWSRYLESVSGTIMVYTDHKNLEYFCTTKVLNRRQARWAQELANYEFKIVYRPGSKNGKPDALSRRSEYRPRRGGSTGLDENQPVDSLLRPEHFISDNEITYSRHVASAYPKDGKTTTVIDRRSVANRYPAWTIPEADNYPYDVNRIIASARLTEVPVVAFSSEFLKRVMESAPDDPDWQKEYNLQHQGKPSPKMTYLAGNLYFKSRLYIPDNPDLRREILESEHDTKVAGHMGQDKTVEIIKRNFYWPAMVADIEGYVRSCEICQRTKTPRHARFGLLHPLELAYSPWESISMDFITDLPPSNECTQVWVIVDRFSKMAHFIPLKDNEKKAEDLARIFVRNIWRLHGLPKSIVSDRDARFTAHFWAGMCDILGMKQKMSSAFQAETDGQTERVNQTVELFIRTFGNYEQNDWEELLPLAEYAYNNSVTTATGLSPFYANYGFHPRTNWPVDNPVRNPASKTYAHWMTSVHETCVKSLERTQERMSKYYDEHKQPPPNIKVGDMVMLHGRNLKTRRPSKKFDDKMFGPFRVERVISPMAIRLKLPRSWKIHPTFHVKLLEPFRTSRLRTPPDTTQILNDLDNVLTEDYVPEKIMGSSFNRGQNRVRYLVQWEGYPDEADWTEEPLEHLENTLFLVEEYHKENPDAVRDPRI